MHKSGEEPLTLPRVGLPVETIDCLAAIALPGLGDGLGPVGMVQRVGIVLGLQGDAGVLAVEHTALALIVQEITGVELDTGTVRVDRHAPPGDGVTQLGAGVAEHLVVVIIATL